MNNNAENSYTNIPGFAVGKDPIEEGDVMNPDKDKPEQPVGASQDVNNIPDSPLADGNAEEANSSIQDTAEEA